MKILTDTGDEHLGNAVIAVSLDELRMLQNAINETLGLISDSEFQTRTGFTRQEMTALWNQLDDAAVCVERG